jgi:hypothetical protein
VPVTIGEIAGSDGVDGEEVTVRNITKNLGMFLLGIWLIVTGALLISLQRTEGRTRWGF